MPSIENWDSIGIDWNYPQLCTYYSALESIRLALVERAKAISYSWTNVCQTPLNVPVKPLVSIKQYTDAIQTTITRLIPYFVNHTDNGGDWTGYTYSELQNLYPNSFFPMWTEAKILESIGAESRLSLDRLNVLSADWVAQQYKILNLLRWTDNAFPGLTPWTVFRAGSNYGGEVNQNTQKTGGSDLAGEPPNEGEDTVSYHNRLINMMQNDYNGKEITTGLQTAYSDEGIYHYFDLGYGWNNATRYFYAFTKYCFMYTKPPEAPPCRIDCYGFASSSYANPPGLFLPVEIFSEESSALKKFLTFDETDTIKYFPSEIPSSIDLSSMVYTSEDEPGYKRYHFVLHGPLSVYKYDGANGFKFKDW